LPNLGKISARCAGDWLHRAVFKKHLRRESSL